MPREMLPLKIKKYDRTTNFFDCFKKKKKNKSYKFSSKSIRSFILNYIIFKM